MRDAEIVDQIVALRRVRAVVDAAGERRRLARVIRALRRQFGAGVPKQQAAAVLGVSVQALDRWIAAGRIPTVRRPGSSRLLVDADALLALAAEVELRRERGERRVLAQAIAALVPTGELRPRLRPNPPARELRHECAHSTAEERLRQAVELSRVGAMLAASPRRRRSTVR